MYGLCGNIAYWTSEKAHGAKVFLQVRQSLAATFHLKPKAIQRSNFYNSRMGSVLLEHQNGNENNVMAATF